MQKLYKVSFGDFMKNFSFYTGCAETIPTIVGAYSSSSRVPLTEKWLGCIYHQINLVTKKPIPREEELGTSISEDLDNFKVIVRVFKKKC